MRAPDSSVREAWGLYMRIASRGNRVKGREGANGGGGGIGDSSSGDGSGDEDGNGNGNEDRIVEGGREVKKRKKPHKSCRRHVGKGGDLGGRRKQIRK